MRLPALVACLALLPLPAPAAGPDAGSASPPRLRGAECLDAARVRAWQFDDEGRVLVDAGRRKYRLRLGGHCPGLATAGELAFRGDSVSGRLCGNPREAVVARGESCPVEAIERLDDAAWAEATAGATATVGASAPLD